MKDPSFFKNLEDRITPYIPKQFQKGKLPYVFLIAWIAIVLKVVLSVITPYPGIVLAPWVSAIFLLLLQLLFIWGLPSKIAVQLALSAGLVQAGYVAWLSGGIFSSRMAWVPLIPLIPFYVISRRSGWVWFAIVLAFEASITYGTWSGWLPAEQALDVSYAWLSFASYSVAMVMGIVVPFIFNRLFRRAYRASLLRNQALEDQRNELLRTSVLREQFIATVSHELRTPMNAILGFNHLLMARVQDNPQALKILNHTKQSADHLLTVINDVLDYSQLQAGKIKIHPETFALKDTIHAAFDLFAQRVESKHVKYLCDIADNVPEWVSSDKHRLMQILVNLLGNAIKFTHQGAVTLSVEHQPLGVYFEIKDTGIGIPASKQEHIFQRFSQADNQIQSRYGGNGLGLAITQRLVTLMGGRIGFESAEGQGSVFWFTLPLSEVYLPQSEPQKIGFVKKVTDESYGFLVVDDHPINRLLVRQILKNRWNNCEIVEADNGVKALAALQAQEFDVVLMDMVMPEMDGIEATTALRQHVEGRRAQTPVLGLTANVNPQDLERFTAAGVNAVLLKPFDPNKVCEQVEIMITVKKSSQDS